MPVRIAVRDRHATRLMGAILGLAALSLAAGRGQGGFDGLLRRLADAAPELRAPAIEQYLNLAGPTPLVEGDTVVFLAESDRGTAPRIIADLPEGESSSSDETARGAMTRIAGTDWYYLKIRLAPATLVRYLVAYEARQEPDPRNPHLAAVAGTTMSEFRMPGGRQPRRPIRERSDPSTWTHAASTSD